MYATTLSRPLDLSRLSDDRLLRIACDQHSSHRIEAKAQLKRRGLIWHENDLKKYRKHVCA